MDMVSGIHSIALIVDPLNLTKNLLQGMISNFGIAMCRNVIMNVAPGSLRMHLT